MNGTQAGEILTGRVPGWCDYRCFESVGRLRVGTAPSLGGSSITAGVDMVESSEGALAESERMGKRASPTALSC